MLGLGSAALAFAPSLYLNGRQLVPLHHRGGGWMPRMTPRCDIEQFAWATSCTIPAAGHLRMVTGQPPLGGTKLGHPLAGHDQGQPRRRMLYTLAWKVPAGSGGRLVNQMST